ncbi:MAG: hypothetical protein JW814_08310 [Candidatus Krumholzibacteriota bacterium]|nr:hypothetical protein [Candidatus Krumholzibacteriota bacterium]
MRLKWSAVLFSSMTFLILISAGGARGQAIRKVEWRGSDLVASNELVSETFLRRGEILTERMIEMELARIDSIYFSHGLLGVEIEIDTLLSGGKVSVGVKLYEGEQALVGKITVTGGSDHDRRSLPGRLGLEEGRTFEPRRLGRSMEVYLREQVDSGYPFAQIWMTGFSFDRQANTVDIVFSQYNGDISIISGVTFEGIARTDTSVALRTSRLGKGKRFSERDLEKSQEYLGSSGLFRSTGRIRVIRSDMGKVELVVPVIEKENSNSFLGAFGFSRKDDGDYRLNGSLRLDLRNIAGKGRDVSLDWLNDGQKYSNTRLLFTEPFLFSMPVHFDGELRQTVQDTLYDLASGGVSLRIPIGPVYSVATGFFADRTLFGGQSAVDRNSRQRYRLGLIRNRGRGLRFNIYLEGARRSSVHQVGAKEVENQLLYQFDGAIEVPLRPGQEFFTRLVSEGVFSRGVLSLSEMSLLGGARSLRGYRENQFRGEKTGCLSLEYRFGEESRIFFFNDTGAYYRRSEGWQIRNGSGFGVVSFSQFGIVELSFGVGEELSLSSTRIHISLTERF